MQIAECPVEARVDPPSLKLRHDKSSFAKAMEERQPVIERGGRAWCMQIGFYMR